MARSTCRRTWAEALAWPEKISTMILQASLPAMIEAPHSLPGRMFRSAIQQRILCRSSTAQAASAHALSFEE
jgi:hypothetical protein